MVEKKMKYEYIKDIALELAGFYVGTDDDRCRISVIQDEDDTNCYVGYTDVN